MITANCFRNYALNIALKYVAILFICGNSVLAGEINPDFRVSDVIEAQIDLRCEISEPVFQQCLGVDVAECRSMFMDIYLDCDNDPSEFLFDQNNSASVNEFQSCVESALLSYISSKGVDLDAECQ